MNKDVKKVKDFFKFRQQNWGSLTNYPDDNLKKLHGRRGKAALKSLGKLLDLDEIKADYNPSGMIDGGYLTLMGMKGDKGIYVSLSCSGFGQDVLYRTIEHMKDYTGGSNNFLDSEDFVNDSSYCIEALRRLVG